MQPVERALLLLDRRRAVLALLAGARLHAHLLDQPAQAGEVGRAVGLGQLKQPARLGGRELEPPLQLLLERAGRRAHSRPTVTPAARA